MKILIDEQGTLHVERAGEMKPQLCPYSPPNANGEDVACGDWCPLFEEPGMSLGEMDIPLCRTTLHCEQGDLIDEREESVLTGEYVPENFGEV